MSIEIVADLELPQYQSGEPEYEAIRKLGLGGSDAGAVCGLSKWRTPYQVWAEKVNPTEQAHRESEAMTWGKLLEAPVREEFSRRTGVEVHPFPRMVRNTDYPFMLASPDGLTGPATKLDGVYEGKTTRFPDQWAIDGDIVSVPLEYMVQGMHYLAVLRLERLFFAVLIGGQELRTATVELDQALVDDLIEIEAAFWQSVIDREPPEATAGDIDTLKRRWQPEAGKQIALPASFKAELGKRATLRAHIKTTEAQVDEIDAKIMAAMGDAEQATLDGQLAVTWRETERTTIDPRALRAAHPEIAAEFSKVSVSRRFLPKEIQA